MSQTYAGTVLRVPPSLFVGSTGIATIIPRSACGNNLPVLTATVVLTASAGITIGAVTNNGNGTYSAVLTGTAAGTVTYTVSINGYVKAYNLPVTMVTASSGYIPPGTGWTGPIAQPSAVGSGPASTEMVIARWARVPYQRFVDTFNVGVVARHFNTIQRVEFYVDGGPLATVLSRALDPQTGQVYFWGTLQASNFPDGHVCEVRAIVYPTAGVPRVLGTASGLPSGIVATPSFFAIANSTGTVTPNYWYVDGTVGSDTNGNGSAVYPFATIGRARNAWQAGDTIMLATAGTYVVATGPTISSSTWMTIEGDRTNPASSYVINSTTTGGNLVPAQTMLAFRNIQFDATQIRQLQAGSNPLWLDHCDVHQTTGWQNSVSDPGGFVTGTTLYDTGTVWHDGIYGPAGFSLVAGSSAYNLSGSFLKNVPAAIGCNANTMAVNPNGNPVDALAITPGAAIENWITESMTAVQASATPAFLLDKGATTYTNIAIWDCHVQTPITAPATTSFYDATTHMIVQNSSVFGQPVVLQTTASSPDAFTATDVLFDRFTYDVSFKDGSGNQVITGTPSGVTVGTPQPVSIGYQLTPPAQDGSGNTIVPTVSTALQGFVAPTGNDSNAGTQVSPWLTPGHGMGKINDGTITQLFIQRAGTYAGVLGEVKVSGTAASPIVIGTYGSGALPVYNCGFTGPQNGPWLFAFARSYVWVIGHDIYFDVRDPTSGTYLTPPNQGSFQYTGIQFVGASTGCLIEGCRTRFAVFGIVVQAAHDPGEGDGNTNVIIRKNQVFDSYPNETGSIQGSGTYIADNVQILYELNHVDHNGYLTGVSVHGPSTFNHGSYNKRNMNMTVRRNIFSRNGNFGLTSSSDNALSNASIDVNGNVFINNGNELTFGCTPGQNGAVTYGLQNMSLANNLFTQTGRMLWQQSGPGNTWVQIAGGSGLSIGSGQTITASGNYFIDKTNGTYSNPEFTLGSVPATGISFIHNTIAGWSGEDGNGTGIVNQASPGTSITTSPQTVLRSSDWSRTVASHITSLGGTVPGGTTPVDYWCQQARAGVSGYTADALLAYIQGGS